MKVMYIFSVDDFERKEVESMDEATCEEKFFFGKCQKVSLTNLQNFCNDEQCDVLLVSWVRVF